MGIFMFITFASANLITIGAMWYGFMSQYRYNNGMVLGVHIPPEHAEEPGGDRTGRGCQKKNEAVSYH